MNLRLVIWMALMLVHFLAGLVAWKGGSEFLGPLVAASVYLPLWPLEQLGLTLTHSTGWFFPPPTVWGWCAVLIFWVLAHYLLATAIARLNERARQWRRNRVAG